MEGLGRGEKYPGQNEMLNMLAGLMRDDAPIAQKKVLTVPQKKKIVRAAYCADEPDELGQTIDFLTEVQENLLKEEGVRYEQIREVVGIEQWLDSEYYLGPTVHFLYDYWKDQVTDIFKDPFKYDEVIITGCGVGSTRIPLLDGRILTLRELAEQYGMREKFWVYSVDEHGRYVPGMAFNARKTGKEAEVWGVDLDNGETAYFTPDHRFMLSNGKYKELKDLTPEDSLYPFDRKYTKTHSRDRHGEGYERIYDPGRQCWIATHNMVRAWKYGTLSMRAHKNGDVIHHKNWDKRDNTPGNLLLMDFQTHIRFHRKRNTLLWKNPEYRSKMIRVSSETMRRTLAKRWSDPEEVERASARMTLRWASGGMREAREKTRVGHKLWLQTEAGKEVARRNIVTYNKDPRYKELRAASVRKGALKTWSKPGNELRRLEHGDRCASRNRDPNFIQRANFTKRKRWEEQRGFNYDYVRRRMLEGATILELRKELGIKASTLANWIIQYGEEDVISLLYARGYKNHRPIRVYFSHYEDVYDFEVERHHNFAIDAGVVVHNSIGTGKTFSAMILFVRKLYELSCFNNVPAMFNLSPTSMIGFVYFNVSKILARMTGFSELTTLIDSIPYFKDHFLRNMRLESMLEFPGNIAVVVGSDAAHSLGINLIGSVLDEANFMKSSTYTKKVDLKHLYSKVRNMYSSILNRTRSRFMVDGKNHALSLLVSSSSYTSSFVETRIEEGALDEKTKIIESRLWDVKPKDTYGEKRFWVFKGSEFIDPQLIEEEEQICHIVDATGGDSSTLNLTGNIAKTIRGLPLEFQTTFLDIPEDFKKSFEFDLLMAMRDIGGVSVAPVGKLVTSKAIYRECVDPKLVCPFTVMCPVIATKDNSDLKLYLRKDYEFKNPQIPRYIHIDQSTTTDATGIAMACVFGRTVLDGVTVPIVTVEFMLKIMPPQRPKQISIRKIREFVFWLQREKGLNIARVSYDWFGCLSPDSSYIYTSKGVNLLRNVAVGDAVLTRDGSFQRVTQKFEYKNVPGKRILTKSGRCLEGTCGHLLEVIRWKSRRKKRVPLYEWVALSDIKPGDVLHTVTEDIPQDGVELRPLLYGDRTLSDAGAYQGSKMENFRLPSVMTPEFAEILGYYYGDGCKSTDGMNFVFGTEDEAFTFNALLEKFFGVFFDVIGPTNETGTGFMVRVFSRFLLRYLEKNGLEKRTARNVGVPSIFHDSPKVVVSAFLRGLFSADGCCTKEGRISLSSVSYSLVTGVKYLLERLFNISSTISKASWKKNGKVSRGYVLRTFGKHSRLLSIGFLHEYKQKQLEAMAHVPGRILYDTVREVEDIMLPEVQDLEVDGGHNYVANGIVVHNSAESIQQFDEAGITSKILSIDKDDSQYLAMLNAMTEHRVKLYDYPPFKQELFDLEHDRQRRKVTHPSESSKDVSDAVAGAIAGALESEQYISPEGQFEAFTAMNDLEEDKSKELRELQETTLGEVPKTYRSLRDFMREQGIS